MVGQHNYLLVLMKKIKTRKLSKTNNYFKNKLSLFKMRHIVGFFTEYTNFLHYYGLIYKYMFALQVNFIRYLLSRR